MISKKTNSARPDEDNPEWTREDVAKARPAFEVLAAHVGENAEQELLRRSKGRPPNDDHKISQTLRIDPDVLEAFRQQGRGWQTRINDVLRQNMPKHEK